MTATEIIARANEIIDSENARSAFTPARWNGYIRGGCNMAIINAENGRTKQAARNLKIAELALTEKRG